MFDFKRWRSWAQQRAGDFASNSVRVDFRSGADSNPKPKLGFGLAGNRVVAVFENWITGEADYTIHAVDDLRSGASPVPMICHKWGMLLTDDTFEQVFEEFIDQFHRAEGGDIAEARGSLPEDPA